jgi:hypothetical protein
MLPSYLRFRTKVRESLRKTSSGYFSPTTGWIVIENTFMDWAWG